MRHAYHLLVGIPGQCARMSYDELLMLAALITLTVAVILMISGRKLA